MEELREHIKEVMADRDSRQLERTALEQKAITTALAANDKRLDGMNEIRGALSDLTVHMITRKEAETAIDAMTARQDGKIDNLDQQVAAKLEPIDATLAQLGKTNWGLLLSAMSVVTVVIVGGWAVIGLKIDASNSPIVLNVEQLRVNKVTRDREMADFGERMRAVEAQNIMSVQREATLGNSSTTASTALDRIDRTISEGGAQRRADTANMRSAVVEMDAKLNGLSNIVGLYRDTSERWAAILFEKAFPGQRMPASQFRPTFSKEQ